MDWNWWSTGITVTLVAAYELIALLLQRDRPEHFARSAHAALREQWFAAVSQQPGSEILAVQTLRNSLMSATMLASTSALALMGTISLLAPSLRGVEASWTPRLALELVLVALLCGSLVATVMAVRFYNHASFVSACPVGSATRLRWEAAGRVYVRRAGVFYSVGLRQFILVVPVVCALFSVIAGPVAALIVVGALVMSDRVSKVAPVAS